MNVGFDPGSHELRVLFQRGHQLIARHCRSAYSLLRDDPTHRQLLVESRLPFGMYDEHLVLLGDAISTVGIRLHSPTWPLLPIGQNAQDDMLAREILAAELEILLPPSPFPDSHCGISLPCPTDGTNGDALSTTREFLVQWVRLRGYTPLGISPGRAMILAEMSNTGFTGLAVTFGSARCTYSLCHHGDELVSGTVERGGQWIDEQLASQLHKFCDDSQGQQWLDTESMVAWKIREAPSLLTPQNAEAVMLRDLYRELLNDVFQHLFNALFDARLPRPFPSTNLLIGGGLSHIAGFREFLIELWLRPGLPLEIDDVIFADQSPFTVARGCLIHAGLASGSEKAAA